MRNVPTILVIEGHKRSRNAQKSICLRVYGHHVILKGHVYGLSFPRCLRLAVQCMCPIKLEASWSESHVKETDKTFFRKLPEGEEGIFIKGTGPRWFESSPIANHTTNCCWLLRTAANCLLITPQITEYLPFDPNPFIHSVISPPPPSPTPSPHSPLHRQRSIFSLSHSSYRDNYPQQLFNNDHPLHNYLP